MPRSVRLAALGVIAEGVVGVVVAVLLALGGVTFSVWGFVALLGLAVGAAGVALVTGTRGARGPSLVAQLFVLGCGFYAAVPSHRPDWGVPVMVLAAVVLYGLLCAPTRAWADAEDGEDAEDGDGVRH
ncbi:hypothetical protein Acsp06_49220 [Actinomycetospora sp. NBRC 106375]|nr:hypothetical protein Acsp06_49220 [Actinomycetospora sp. NBRC 106375]